MGRRLHGGLSRVRPGCGYRYLAAGSRGNPRHTYARAVRSELTVHAHFFLSSASPVLKV